VLWLSLSSKNAYRFQVIVVLVHSISRYYHKKGKGEAFY